MIIRLSAVLGLALAAPTWAQDGSSEPIRPVPTAFGVGAGISVPSGALGLNTASARVVFSDAVTLEPTIGFGISSSTSTTEVGGNSTETVNRSSSVDIGAQVRVAVTRLGRADMVVLPGAGFTRSTSETDPEGADNSTTTTSTGIGLSWGLGVNYWISKHWCFSADAINPLVGLQNSTTVEEATDVETSTNGMGLTVAFDPTVRVMGHVFF